MTGEWPFHASEKVEYVGRLDDSVALPTGIGWQLEELWVTGELLDTDDFAVDAPVAPGGVLGGEETVQNAAHEASASAGIVAGQHPRPSFRHSQADADPLSSQRGLE